MFSLKGTDATKYNQLLPDSAFDDLGKNRKLFFGYKALTCIDLNNGKYV